MSSGITIPIRASESQVNVFSPVFSPDGQSVAFQTEEGTLKRAHLAGGAATTVCAVPNRTYWVTWAGDDLFFSSSDGLMRVPASGGTPETIIGTRPEERIQRAQVLTDRKIVIYTVVPAGMELEDRWATAQIVAQSLETGAREVLVTGASDGWYTPTGHLLYMIGGTLHAVRFDAASLEITGTALPIVEGVMRSSTSLGGIGWFSVSSTGTLIYLPGPTSVTSTQLVLGIVEQNGTVTTLKLPPAPYRHPRVSPDGQRIVLETDDGKDAAVRVYELSSGDAPQRRTFAGRNRFPIWTSDSRRVAFQSDRQGDAGIFWQVADGSRDAERLTTAAAGESHIPESWHRDGDVLLFSVARGPDYSLRTYSVRDKRTVPFGDVRGSIPTDGVFSPDGKWVAYSCGAFAQATIFIQPFPATGAKYELPGKTGSSVPHHPCGLPTGRSSSTSVPEPLTSSASRLPRRPRSATVRAAPGNSEPAPPRCAGHSTSCRTAGWSDWLARGSWPGSRLPAVHRRAQLAGRTEGARAVAQPDFMVSVSRDRC